MNVIYGHKSQHKLNKRTLWNSNTTPTLPEIISLQFLAHVFTFHTDNCLFIQYMTLLYYLHVNPLHLNTKVRGFCILQCCQRKRNEKKAI